MAGTVGVLALQGDFEAHGVVLRELGASVREVRVADDLDGLAALVLPGGELCARVPVLATCAGMIMLDREHLAVLEMRCERNAFGRQVRSFEGDIALEGFAAPFRAVFIRAPWVAEHAPDVKVLAAVEGRPVAVSAGGILAVAFHPELTGEARLHRRLLDQL